MKTKISILSLFLIFLGYSAHGQRIVVDTTSSSKYLMSSSKTSTIEESGEEEELSFGDRAVSIGQGILSRLRARFNLDEAAESIKDKKDKFLGKEEEADENDSKNTPKEDKGEG